MAKLKVLQIVVKNTSELDFSFPLLCHLKKNDHADVTILYCSLSKYQFLRHSQFFSEKAKEIGIRECDFSDFLYIPFISNFIRNFFKRNYSDRIPPGESFENFKKNKKQSLFLRLYILLRAAFDNFGRLPEKLAHRLIRKKNLFSSFAPDIILLGNRTKSNFYGRAQMYSYFQSVQKPVILLPHGTHEVHPTQEFIPYDERGEALASFCQFWSAFKETPWQLYPEKKHQFFNVGYPGLDSRWLNEIHSVKSSSQKGKTCTLILRKILPEYLQRPDLYDPFTLNYSDMLLFLNNVADACSFDDEIDFIIKPHPSNNFELLAQLLKDSRLKNWKITQEPFYGILNETDFVISLFSTSVLIPLMAGIPCIVFETELQRYVHNRWPLLADMYKGLQFYCSEAPNLQKTVKTILSQADPRNLTEPDIRHLRQFYSDNSIQTCWDRIKS